MMGAKERIEYLVEREGSASSFAKRIGTSESSVSKLRNGSFRLDAYAVRIARAYPHLNCRWLLTGEGEPFFREMSKDELREKIDEMQKTLQIILGRCPTD